MEIILGVYACRSGTFDWSARDSFLCSIVAKKRGGERENYQQPVWPCLISKKKHNHGNCVRCKQKGKKNGEFNNLQQTLKSLHNYSP